VFIQHHQESAGLLAGLTCEPAQAGDARGVFVEEDGQQAMGRRQADAFGLRGTGEPGQAVAGEGDDLWAAAELAQASAESEAESAQASRALRQRLGVERLGDGVGLTVEGLTGAAALAGQAGDVAVSAVENDVGTGEAVGQG
jgi:hypothetical protein